MKKILIGTPVRQDPLILSYYLKSLEELNKDNLLVDYCFVDDNDDNASSVLLNSFVDSHKGLILSGKDTNVYERDENTHHWNEELIKKVASYKNRIIEYSLTNNYDYLFFVDSDLCLQSNTLQQLISADKDIISEVFWTEWTSGSNALPQVWVTDFYTLYSKSRNEVLTEQQVGLRTWEFLHMLRQPGVYEVGGLGALTLIKRHALEKGVNFNEIKNVSFAGEDRHFCIRAAVLGIQLFVDTHLPAYHIYRKTDLFRLMGRDGVSSLIERLLENNVDESEYDLLKLLNPTTIVELEHEETASVNLLNKVAIHWFGKEEYEQVIPLLQKANELKRDDIDTLYNLAYVLCHFGEHDMALGFVNDIQEKDDDVMELINYINEQKKVFI